MGPDSYADKLRQIQRTATKELEGRRGACGWNRPGTDTCVRKRRRIWGGECDSCRYWVKRGRLDRIRGRVGR